MRNEFGFKWDRKAGCTHVYVRFSAPVFRNPSSGEWEKYAAECRKSLHQVAARESVEILAWSIDVDRDEELARITHHVDARGLLQGLTPLRIARALSPARGYATLDTLAQALKKGLPIHLQLKRAAESNCIRFRNGRPLPEHIPAPLLALALAEPAWRRLVSPMDNPWAYINTTTRLIYQNKYAEGNAYSSAKEVACGLSPQQERTGTDAVPAGDELGVENIFDTLRNSGCSTDAVIVEMARSHGRKRNELPAYLTELTGTSWDDRRVEAGRGSFRRKSGKLRASALAGSRWVPRPNGGSVYRERLPDGAAWNGRWTYSHSLQGKSLETYREVMANERKKLFRAK